MTDRRPSAGELAVGDVRLTRTFRIGPNGELFPVNTADAWADGWNIATCRRGLTHTAPDPDCRCGFYLYSDPAYVLSQPPGRQVLAVCSVAGAVETGTRGARVERARVDALWLGHRVSLELAGAVQRRYPSTRVYRNRAAMDAEFPLSHLAEFRTPKVGERRRLQWRRVTWVYLGAVAVLGCIPAPLVVTTWAGAIAWLAAVAGGFALMVTALAQRSPVTALQGICAIAWLVTSSTTSLGQMLARALFVLPMLAVSVIWWRAASPGQTVSPPRLDVLLRRWYALRR